MAVRPLTDGRAPITSAPSLEELQGRRDELLAVFGENGAREVRVFGSVARGEQDAESDVDFVVCMQPGRSLFDLGALIANLEEVLGCPVNVVSEGGIRQGTRFAARVERDAVPL